MLKFFSKTSFLSGLMCARLVTQELHNFTSFAAASSSSTSPRRRRCRCCHHRFLLFFVIFCLRTYSCVCSMLAFRLLYLHLVFPFIVSFDNCICIFFCSCCLFQPPQDSFVVFRFFWYLFEFSLFLFAVFLESNWSFV